MAMKKNINLLVIIILLISMKNVQAQQSDYKFMILQATQAPSGHNTQPWLFKMKENSIEIHPDFDKALPIVDPDHRELFISLGCAAENLCIAAFEQGYDAEVKINDTGIISVFLRKNEGGLHHPLFPSIALRQTNRSVYNGQPIPENNLDMLRKIPADPSVRFYFYENGSSEFDAISSYVIRGNTIQMQDTAFVQELKSWMRYNKKHQNTTADGLSYAVFGAPNLPMFIVKPIMSGYLNETKQNKGDIKKMQSSSHFVLFTTQANTIVQWIDLGRTLERFLLQSTRVGIVHAYLNQPNETANLSTDMARALNIPHEYPTILLRIGLGERMPYSKRKTVEEVIID